MTTEYIAKIKGDISGLEKALKQAQGRLERLEDNEVIIKFDYDSNEQELNKIIKNLLSKNPELNVDIQYHLNKAALEQEKKKLSDMELSADPSRLIEEIQKVHKEYTNMFQSASDEELDKAEHYMAQLYATILNCADGFDLLEKLPKELQEQLEELAEVDPLKAFSEKEIQKQKDIINELEESIARLQEKASKVELTTNQDNFEESKEHIDDTVISLEKLLERFSEYNKAHNYKNASAFWDEYKKKIEEGDEEAKELLKTLQLLNSNESIDIVNDGAVKSGGIIGDDKVLLATRTNKNTDANKLQDTIALKKKLDEASEAGINVARILNIVSDAENKVFFEIQEKAKGNMLGSYENNWVNPDVFEATDEQIKKLILDLQKLNELGIGVDVNPTNIFYDKAKGFSFIDLDLNPATFKDQRDLIQDALSGITGEISVFYEELGDTAGISKVEAFENHIKELAQTLQGTATDAIKSTQDSASPADESRKLGHDFGEGYALGIGDKVSDVGQAAADLSNAALTAIREDDANFWMAGVEHARQYERGINEGISNSKVNTNAKDFYDKYGTPTQALDANVFARVSEVIDELGGQFKELNVEADDFNEQKLNTVFFEELIKQIRLSEDELLVVKGLLEDINTILPGGKFAHLSDERNNAVQIDKQLNKINGIVSGSYSINDQDIKNAKDILSYSDKPVEITVRPRIDAEVFQNELNESEALWDTSIDVRVNPFVDPGEFAREITNDLDEHSAYIKVRPDIIPDKFADETTAQLTEPAFIDVRPLVNAESIQREIESELRDRPVKVQIEAELTKNRNDNKDNILSNITLYHGSNVTFDKFDPNRMNDNAMFGKGAYFTFSNEDAQTYGYQISQWFANINKAYEESAKLSEEELKQIYNEYNEQIKQIWGNGFTLDDFINEMKNDSSSLKTIAEDITDLSEEAVLKNFGYQARIFDLIESQNGGKGIVIFDTENITKANDLIPRISSELTEGVKESKDTTENEVATLSSLLEPLERVKQSILEKNQLLEQEGEIVKTTVWSEIDGFNLLIACLEEIVKAIGDLKGKFGDISFGSLNTLINKLSDSNASERVQTLTENIDELADHLKNLNIDNTGFIDAVNQIIEAGKELKTVVKDAETVNKAVKDSGIKPKQQDKRSTKDIFKEQLEAEKEYIRLINKSRRSNGLNEKETIELEEVKQKLEDIASEFEKIDINTDEAKASIAEYNKELSRYESNLDKGNTRASEINANNELESQREALDKLEKKAREVYSNIDKYREGFRNNLENIASKEIDLSNIDEVKAKIKELTESLDDKTLKENLEGTYTKLLNYYEKIQKTLATEPNMAPAIKQKYRALADEIDNLVKSGTVLPGVLNRITKAFIDLNAEDAKTKGFFRAVADRTREMNVKFLGQFFSFYDIIRYGREILSVVEELDTSLVDLRKTTAMTAKELDEFYYESNKIARQMGVTTNEIITQASAWSRLGYNTAEATKQMAQLSSKFASISPGMDVDKAQEGLVSIMKAWDIETDEAERKILDNINTLGNKFAETNADIVTGMEKSAATFAALGQSAEDAFALFTGAQEVMQNAEVVGTALKTLSLRIRGYDEETEELSEDLVNLKGKVVDLTKTAKHTQGVSLFTDASQTHYKSMVQYLGEIAEIWDEIDEKSRTELLDKLFGKRGASVGSAIIGNFDQVKKALAEMETAAGSAESEMDIIRDSVEFKLNELKNVWIGYIQQLLQREDIGEIIDQLIEGSESLQSVIDAATPLIHEFIELLSDLLGVLSDIAKSSDAAIPALGGLLALNGINNKFELFKILGNKKVFDGMSSAIKGTALESSKLTESFISLSSLLTSPGFWGLAGVVAFSAALYKLYKSEEEIYKQAQEATKEYDNREKSLEKYKTKIIELRKTADDSTLSIEEQQRAREELLSIQSEMVEQFGAEAAKVDILRDSIDRLNDSFDTLSESSYQEFLNSVNRNEGWDGFWHKLRTGEMFDPSVSNATYIQDQMENASSQLFGNVDVSTKGQQKLAKLFNERGFNVKYNEGMGEYYMSPANLQDYYDTLLDIQIKYRNNQEEIGVSTYKELSKEVERVNKILTSISPTYNEMLEHDTIMPKYQDTIDKLKTAMSEIYNARVAEDEKGVEAASKRLTQIYDNFLKTVDDPAIINWFEQYVAEYEAIMNKTRFTEGLNNNANYQIAKTNNKKYGYTKEELEAAANMDDEAINNIADIHKRVIVQRIKMAAHDAEIPVSVVIDQLEADKAAITGLEKQLREIHGDFKIDSLSPEDLQIVLNLSNALHLSWEQIQKEIVKSKQHMKEMSKIEMIDNINDMADGFDKLDEVYADVFDKGSFDFTTLASKKFEEAFSGLDPEIYAEFIETISEYPDDLGKTQEAFDKLAGAFIEQRGILDGLTNDNKKVAIQMLENMGIANAEEVVTERLNAQLEAQRYQSEALAAASADVVSGSYNNSKSFLEQASMSDYAKIQLMNLVASQTIFSNQNLSVGDKIRSLESLASAYMGTAAAAELSQKIQNDSRYSKEGLTEESLLANWNKVTSKYTKLTVPNVKYTGGDKTKDAKDKAAKSAEKDKELFDWIETKVQRIEREITNLGKIADATYKTWGERTVALGQEMEKVTEQIGLQQTAYATYMKQAEAFDLSKDYKDKVINGALAIDEVTDDVLKKKIKDFKEIYEKALAAQDKIEDLRSSFANLAKAKFDNITTQFDDIISDVEHMTKYITAQLESVETVGKIAGKSFYEAQIAQEQERLNDLTAELGQLQTALAEGLASGAIAYGSQMFNEMKKSIYSVEESILDANNAILKFEQNIKQVAKANFDDLLSQFDHAIGILTSKLDLTDNIISMIESSGHVISRKYYEALSEGEEQNIKNLKKKYDELNKVFEEAVSSGDISPYTDEWYLIMPHYLVISIANLFNCWNSLKLIKLQRRDEICSSVIVVKAERIYQIA